MQVIPFTYNSKDELISNTYIFVDGRNKCVIIDPSLDYDGIVEFIKKYKYKPQAILITHAHFDHIGGIPKLLKAFKLPVYAGYEEIETFTDPYKNCSQDFSSHGFSLNLKIKPLGDNEVLKLLDEEIKVIYTPYHTNGAVCFYFPKSKILFSGDSLFHYALGRTDLPTSVPSLQEESISKLMGLPDDIRVYPGHGPFTTIGNERRFMERHK